MLCKCGTISIFQFLSTLFTKEHLNSFYNQKVWLIKIYIQLRLLRVPSVQLCETADLFKGQQIVMTSLVFFLSSKNLSNFMSLSSVCHLMTFCYTLIPPPPENPGFPLFFIFLSTASKNLRQPHAQISLDNIWTTT